MAAGDYWRWADGFVALEPPQRCPAGHLLKGQVEVSTVHCYARDDHPRHTVWTCRGCGQAFEQTCDQATTERPAGNARKPPGVWS